MAKRPRVNRTSSDTPPELLSSEQLPAATPEHSEGSIETLIPSSTDTSSQGRKASWDAPPIPIDLKRQIAERVKQDPLISYSELAAELNVSDDVVGRIARKVAAGDDDLGDKRIRSFQRQIGKELPVRERVMIYADVARGVGDPKSSFSKIAALKRLEELEGVVTAKERKEVADNAGIALPMFVLKDADVDIGVAIKVRKRG